jgi:hypothetical protein
MFPKELNGAQVLYFSQKENYGEILFITGEIAAHVHYLAICKYKNDSTYYLFDCDGNFDVVGDSVWDSIEKCMSVAASSYGRSITWINVP